MTDPGTELTDDLLAAWLAGEIGAEEAAAIEEQVVRHPGVAARVDRLAETMALMDQAAAAAPRTGFSERLAAGIRSGLAASVTTTGKAAGPRAASGHRRERSAAPNGVRAPSPRWRLDRLTGALAVVLVVAVTGGLGVNFFRSQAARQDQIDAVGSDGRLDTEPADTQEEQPSDLESSAPAAGGTTAGGRTASPAAPSDPDQQQNGETDGMDDSQPVGSAASSPPGQDQPASGTSGAADGGTGQQPPADGGPSTDGQEEVGDGSGGQSSGGQVSGSVGSGGAGSGDSARPTGEATDEDLTARPTPPPAVEPGAADPPQPAVPASPDDNSDPDLDEDGVDGDGVDGDGVDGDGPSPEPVTAPVEEDGGGDPGAPAPAAPPSGQESDAPAPAVNPDATSPRVLDSQATLADAVAARGYFGGRGEARAQLGLGPDDARARGASHLRQLGAAAAFSDGTPPGRCAGAASAYDPSVIVTVESVVFDDRPALAYLVVTGTPTLDSARVIITDRFGCGVLAEIAVTT